MLKFNMTKNSNRTEFPETLYAMTLEIRKNHQFKKVFFSLPHSNQTKNVTILP